MSSVQLMILILLRNSPKTHGYKLIRKLDNEFSTWKPKTGTIYPALNRLSERGLVKYKKIERRGSNIKKYKITIKGDKLIKKTLIEMEKDFKFMDQFFNFLEKNILKEEKKIFREVLEVLK